MALPEWLENQINKAKGNNPNEAERRKRVEAWAPPLSWASNHPQWQDNLVWTDIDAVFDQYDGIDSLFNDIAEIKRRVMRTNKTGERYIPVTYNQGVYRWNIRWEKTTPTHLGLLGYQDLIQKGYLLR